MRLPFSSQHIHKAARILPAWAVLSLWVPSLCLAGCERVPGRPGPGPEIGRPEAELNFAVLYKDNCAGCHGNNGRDGAAISLANPVYIAITRDHLHDIISKGVSGSLMPAFGKSFGGMLTDQQVSVIAQGIVQQWGSANALGGQSAPAYAPSLKGDVKRGQQVFSDSCARCHGANGEGAKMDAGSQTAPTGSGKTGSIVDGSYLALLSDQNLRSIAIAGRPDQGMPDWRGDGAHPLTDQQITDIVAWIESHRVADPGQPYPAHP